MKQKFIITNDVDTRTALLSLGFQEVSNTNNVYTFINSKPITFAEDNIDKSKITFSNMLCI